MSLWNFSKAIYRLRSGSVPTTDQKSQPDVSDSAAPNRSGSLPLNISPKRSPTTTAISGVNATGEVPSRSPSQDEKRSIISIASASHTNNNQSRTENVVAPVHVSEPEQLPTSGHNVENQTALAVSETDRNTTSTSVSPSSEEPSAAEPQDADKHSQELEKLPSKEQKESVALKKTLEDAQIALAASELACRKLREETSQVIDSLKRELEEVKRDLSNARTAEEDNARRHKQDQDLLTGEREKSTELNKSLDDVRSLLTSAESAYSKLQAEASQESEGLKRELEATRQELYHSGTTLEDNSRRHEEDQRLLNEERQKSIRLVANLDEARSTLASVEQARSEDQAVASSKIGDLLSEVERLQQDLANAVSTIDGLRVQEERVRDLLDEEKETSSGLRKSLEEVELALASSERARSTLQADAALESERLTSEVTRMRQELSDANATIRDTRDLHEQGQRLLNDERGRSAELKGSLDETQSTLAANERKFSESLTEMSRKVDELVEERNGLVQEVETKKQELASAISTIEEIEKRHVQDEELLSEEREATALLKGSLADVQNTLSCLERAYSELEDTKSSEIEKLSSENGRLVAEIEQSKSEGEDLVRELEGMRQELLEAEATIEEITTQHKQEQDALNVENDKLKQMLGEVRSALTSTEHAYTELLDSSSQQIECMTQTNTELIQQTEALTHEVAVLTKENEETRCELEESRRDLGEARATIEDYEHRHQNDQDLLDEEKTTSSSLAQSLESVQASLKSSEDAYSVLKEELSGEKEASRRKLNKAKQDNEKTKNALADANATIEETRRRLEQNQGLLNEEREKSKQLAKELDTIRAALTSAKQAASERETQSAEKFDKLAQETEVLKQELADVNETVKEYEQQQQRDQELLEQEKATTASLRKSVRELTISVESLTQDKQFLVQASKDLRKELEEKENELATTIEENTRRQALDEQILNEERKRATVLKEQVDETRSFSSSVQQAYNNLRSEWDNLLRDNEWLRRDLHKALAKVSELEAAGSFFPTRFLRW